MESHPCVPAQFQSTHSLRSATSHGSPPGRPVARFNPRTPCGVRRCQATCVNPLLAFQSTHSLRSATLLYGARAAQSDVSIHALLAECDGKVMQGPMIDPVSIHALLAECDAVLAANIRTSVVSIHALLAECDPRYGMRLYSLHLFQSTHSLRSATFTGTGMNVSPSVSIHALLAECDLTLLLIISLLYCFNPRTPCGVRLRLTIYIVIQQRKRYFAPTSRRRPSSPSLLF